MNMDDLAYQCNFTVDLVLAGRLWRRMAREGTAQYGIAEAGAGPLLAIGRLGEGARQHQVAERCGIEGASLVRVLDELTRGGLVERRQDPSDRRANALYLTAEGRKRVQQVEIELVNLRRRVLGTFDPEDLAAARRVFDAIKTASGRVPGRVLETID